MEKAYRQDDDLPIEKRIRWMCSYKNLNEAKYCKIIYSRANKEDVGEALISVLWRAHIPEDIQRKIFEGIVSITDGRSPKFIWITDQYKFYTTAYLRGG